MNKYNVTLQAAVNVRVPAVEAATPVHSRLRGADPRNPRYLLPRMSL